MKAKIKIGSKSFQIDFGKPIPISITLQDGFNNPNCFYAPPIEFSPVVAGDFIGSTEQGGAVNFKNIRLNPHGNGTHTECVGHIAKEIFVLRESLQKFHFPALLISVFPEKQDNGDRVITLDQVMNLIQTEELLPAIIFRTLPNPLEKGGRQYSGTNPPYFSDHLLKWLADHGVNHLLTDLPSVDREEDGGALLGHKAFWNYPNDIRQNATISELVYVNDSVQDGVYLLNLQVLNIDLDVSPSNPILYQLIDAKEF